MVLKVVLDLKDPKDLKDLQGLKVKRDPPDPPDPPDLLGRTVQMVILDPLGLKAPKETLGLLDHKAVLDPKVLKAQRVLRDQLALLDPRGPPVQTVPMGLTVVLDLKALQETQDPPDLKEFKVKEVFPGKQVLKARQELMEILDLKGLKDLQELPVQALQEEATVLALE